MRCVIYVPKSFAKHNAYKLGVSSVMEIQVSVDGINSGIYDGTKEVHPLKYFLKKLLDNYHR
jgi:hypothetical protein